MPEVNVAILALATSGPHGGLALQSDGDALHTAPLAAGRGRGRDVLPGIRALLTDAGLEARDLTAVAVDVGPGSFTGVRVGVTVAKTLAWTLGLEVLAVSALDLIAAAGPADGALLAVRDAGRGTVYHARFVDGVAVGEAGRAHGERLGATAAGATLVGEEATRLAAQFGWAGRALDVAPGAADLLALALARRTAGGAACPAHQLVPCYLQASAPERKAAGEIS